MATNTYILEYDAFIRSIKQNKNVSHAVLLGAGASISSQIQSAADCIWEWKRDIYSSNNPNTTLIVSNFRSESVRRSIQAWLDGQGEYPMMGASDEYSFYAEKAYPIEADRQKYFEQLAYNKAPYIGYKLLCLLNNAGLIKSVWTTNFDGLTERAAHQMNITPICITLDDPERIFRNENSHELLYIALHGDYKYSKLKNTTHELDTQNNIFRDALKRYFVDKNLIVIGYSGRDKSLMNALKEAFSQSGSGRLYWCGFGDDICSDVKELIDIARSNNRIAYFIPTDGFDKTMLQLSRACFEDDIVKQEEIKKLIKSTIKKDETKTSFRIESSRNDKLIKSNLHPVAFPKDVYQFEIKTNGEHLWNNIDQIIGGNKDIVAVPFKGKVFAVSSIAKIKERFGGYIKGEILKDPIGVDDIRKVSVFQRLMMKSILIGISELANLETDGKWRLWKKNTLRRIVNGTEYFIADAVELSFFFGKDTKFAYLSIKPTIYIYTHSDEFIPKDIKLQFTKEKFDRLYNAQYDQSLEEWNNLIFHNNSLRFTFPVLTTSDMSFSISNNVAFSGIKVLSDKYKSYPVSIEQKRIVFKGVEFLEPQLLFQNKNSNFKSRDFHPMRGLINHYPFDYQNNGITNTFNVKLGVLCSSKYSTRLYEFLMKLNAQHKAPEKNEYIIDYAGFNQIYNIPIEIPLVNDEKCMDVKFNSSVSIKDDALNLARIICTQIEALHESYKTDMTIVIFIPNEWQPYRHIEEDTWVFDLHDYIKAYSAQKRISTQFIEEDTLNDSLTCQIYWWLSLSFYVKSLRTPWVLNANNNETAYAGIGYSIKNNNGEASIVLGCSHIYDSHGQGLKYKLSRVQDCYIDNKRNPYLSYNEAYNFGISIRELFLHSMEYLPKRVVVHKRTEFKPDEVNGIVDSLQIAGIENIDLISINFEREVKFMSTKSNYGQLQIDNFPIRRGTCIVVNDYEALLWTHGIVPSVKSDNRTFYLGGRSIPSPLIIKKHYGKSDINVIATEILGLTKMNWNSFDLYTKLPATIDSSNQIARIGNLLTRFEGKTYDYRFFI